MLRHGWQQKIANLNNYMYGKCPNFKHYIIPYFFLPKLGFFKQMFLKYLVEWQTLLQSSLIWVYTVFCFNIWFMKFEDIYHNNFFSTSSFFRENNVPPPWIFSFSTAVTLKIMSRSPKSNQFFVMSQIYIHENLANIQPLVHKILCGQGCVTTRGCAPKWICPPPLKCREIILPLSGTTKDHAVWPQNLLG